MSDQPTAMDRLVFHVTCLHGRFSDILEEQLNYQYIHLRRGRCEVASFFWHTHTYIYMLYEKCWC